METLLGLFDAAGFVSDVLSRTEEKNQELESLAVNVQSISLSVRAWSQTMPEEDRNAVFNANPVFPHLAKVLNQAKEVLQRNQKPMSPEAMAPLEDAKPKNGFRGILNDKMKQGSRTLQEGLEALSGRMGAMGSGLLRLPEDELSKVKEANEIICKLLPTLTLAIQATPIRGAKRGADMLLSDEPPAVRLRIESEAVTRSESGSTQQPSTSEVEKRPLLNLHLVSDAPFAESRDQGMLTTMDLKLSSVNQSTTSLESADGSSLGDDAGQVRLVLGRADLQKRVSLRFPKGKGHSVLQFVSREFLLLEVADLNLAPTQGSMEMATLAWGCWNDSQQDDEKPPLAHVSGLKGGYHLRKAHHTRWEWKAKGEKAGIEEGDTIAIVLESPPDSEAPARSEDLDAEEVRCILGCELRRPVN